MSTTKPSLTFLTIGASGTGKSALINGLVGKEVAKEGGESLRSQTVYIAPYKAMKQGIELIIWDTPGMESLNASLSMEKLADIQSRVREVDLVLFCTNMTSARFRQGDSQNVRIMTKAFGESIWKNAVFVLTFANQIKPPLSRKGISPREYFDERLLDWKGQIRDILKMNGVSAKLAESVEVVPAGYSDDKCSLPGQYDWLSELWNKCVQVSNDKVPVLLQVNKENLETERFASYHYEKPPNEMPWTSLHIVQTPLCCISTALAVLGGITGLVAGGAVGCIAGIAVGTACGLGAAGTWKYFRG